MICATCARRTHSTAADRREDTCDVPEPRADAAAEWIGRTKLEAARSSAPGRCGVSAKARRPVALAGLKVNKPPISLR